MEKSKKGKSEKAPLEPLVIPGFTKYPPDGVFTSKDISSFSAYQCYPEVDLGFSLQMKQLEDDFKSTNDPLIALEAILKSDKMGFYPPGWALKWVIDGFKNYRKSNGKITLDRILGFGVKRKRQRLTDVEKENIKLSNDADVTAVVILVALGLKQTSAFQAVSKKHGTHKPEVIKKLFFARDKKQRDRDLTMWADVLSAWSKRERENYLNCYLKYN